jgi:hypothetical protein
MQREATQASKWKVAAPVGAGLLIVAAVLASGSSLGSALAALLGAAALVLVAAGLAELFVVRREREQVAGTQAHEQRLSQELQAARAHVERQLDLLAAIAQRAETWSGAAASLARVEQAMERAQQESQAQALELVRNAAHDFRAELKSSFEESVRASKEVFVPLVEDAARRAAEAAREPLGQIVETVASELARRGEAETTHWRALEEQLRGWLSEVGQREGERGDRLAELTTRLEQHLEGASALARQQLDAGSAAERERETRAAAGLEKLSALATAVVEAGQRQRAELASEARRLAESLTERGRDLSEHFAASSERVGEAAAGVQAGAAEVSSAAALFSQAVDRHREAASGWLASLAEVEGAVERAGQGAAAEALRDQLAATQQIFARQLEFQRELFEQLRALRSAPAGGSEAFGEVASEPTDPSPRFEAPGSVDDEIDDESPHD